MRKYIVNNTEVEYLRIEEKRDGTIEVHFEEKFNLVNAHMSVIMSRLRENNLFGCHVFKDLQHNIITIMLHDIDQLYGVLHTLNVNPGCYEVYYEDALVIVDVPVLQRCLSVEEGVGV